MRIFGEKIFYTIVAGAATDDLILYLLDLCNLSTALFPEPDVKHEISVNKKKKKKKEKENIGKKKRKIHIKKQDSSRGHY